ncbi:MAG: DNA-binding Lrp family transcriptional regulator, partial [Natrialbaceae archaeon]
THCGPTAEASSRIPGSRTVQSVQVTVDRVAGQFGQLETRPSTTVQKTMTWETVPRTMVRAFVMAITASGTSEAACETITDFEHVREAHVIAGDYDLMIEMESDEVYELLHAVSTEFQNIEGVGSTRTYIALQ